MRLETRHICSRAPFCSEHLFRDVHLYRASSGDCPELRNNYQYFLNTSVSKGYTHLTTRCSCRSLIMPRRPSTIPYRCHFCRERLEALPLQPSDYVRVLMLVRPYQCPHCFAPASRPFAWIGRMPFLGRIFQSSVFASSLRSKGNLAHRDDRMISQTTHSVARFGRWVERWERRCGKVLKTVFGAVAAVLWKWPLRMLGIRTRRRRTQKMKPRRW